MTSEASVAGASASIARPARIAAITGLFRVLVALRLAALVTAVSAELAGSGRSWVLLSQLSLGVATLLALVYWRQAASMWTRPAYMTLDVAAAVVTIGMSGSEVHVFSYSVATAALAGALYGRKGAVLSAAALVTGYWVALFAEFAPDTPPLHEIIGRPVLFPIYAMFGAALHALLIREADAIRGMHAARAEAAAQQERNRLARELHDYLGKTLVGLSFGATGLVSLIRRDPGAAHDRARQFAAAAEAAVNDARRLVIDLRVDPLDGTVAQVVRRIAEDWQRDSGVECQVEVDELSLSPDVRHELLSVLQEALRNVARHAQARTVHVALRSTKDAVTLTVRDDGRGARASLNLEELVSRGSFGVVGMRERVVRVGGEFEIDSQPGVGTTVTAEVPVG